MDRYSLLLLSLLFLPLQSAHGALGEPVSAARSLSIDANAPFTVQRVTSGGSEVREYVSASGVVFGVAWSGKKRHPDLTSVLGQYDSEYQVAARQTPRQHGRRRLAVKSEHLVVEKWGHMRNLQGRAYDPSLLPQGVTVDEIK